MRARAGAVAAAVAGGTLVLGTVAIPAAGGAAASGVAFSAPTELPSQVGTGGVLSGGEPSLSLDVASNGVNAYVSAPQSVPAIVGGILNPGACKQGVAFWRSTNGGGSFSPGRCIGSGLGGGDNSTAVTPNHKLYVADLEAVAAAICRSTDFGLTFSSPDGGGCTTLVSDQTGPEDDRPWLTAGPQNQVYFTYHDFAFGFPLIERSDDSARTFAPCGTILQPGSAAQTNYSPLGGTLVANPAVDKSGSLYVEVSEPTNTAITNVASVITNLYMAVGKGGCKNGTVFKDSTIYANPGANLGNIFDADTVDGGGTVYVVAAGKTRASDTAFNVWLFVSHDGGTSWSKPVQVNPPGLKANVMPAIVGGPKAGQVAIGWFGSSTSNTPNGTQDVWNYYVATSTSAGAAGSFALAKVTPTPFHYGDVCTEGVFCGSIPGGPSNRNLLDFDSIAVNPLTGCLVLAIPGDPYNTFAVQKAGKSTNSSSVYVARQTSGCFALG